MSNSLLQLQALGQSPWHDNIRRSLLANGEERHVWRLGKVKEIEAGSNG